jgi:FkbM family methyltransferase
MQTKKISNRNTYENFFIYWINILIKKYLTKKARVFNNQRGRPMAVFANDIIGTQINLYGLFEKEHLEDLRNLLQITRTNTINSTAIDVGANIGNNSLYYSSFFNKVICFEPNPRSLKLLKANTNEIKNIEVYGHGCGESVQKSILYERFGNIGATSLDDSIEYSNSFEVIIKPLDDMLNELVSVSLIKIDVEGAELSVLKGAEKVISKFKPVICFEQLENEFTGGGDQETPSINWLRFKGYKIFGLYKKNKSYVLRRMNNIMQIFFGINENREIIEYEKIPKKFHEALYAIHPSTIKK